MLRRAACVLLILAAAGVRADDEQTIDNPEFASWAKHPVGTAIKLKQTAEFAGTPNVTIVTQKLLEKADDELKVEFATEMVPANPDFPSPTIKRTIKRQVKVAAGKDPKAKPEGFVDEGTEELTVDGKKIKTKWVRVKLSAGGTEGESQVWTSEDVPGLAVKSVSKLTMPIASTVTSELTSFKTP